MPQTLPDEILRQGTPGIGVTGGEERALVEEEGSDENEDGQEDPEWVDEGIGDLPDRKVRCDNALMCLRANAVRRIKLS